jgi:hypothetical protein
MRRYLGLNWKLFNLFWRLKRWKSYYSAFSSEVLRSALRSVAVPPYGGLWMILRPSLTTFGGEMIDPTEICRAMFAGGVVAILLAIFSEVIYEGE